MAETYIELFHNSHGTGCSVKRQISRIHYRRSSTGVPLYVLRLHRHYDYYSVQYILIFPIGRRIQLKARRHPLLRPLTLFFLFNSLPPAVRCRAYSRAAEDRAQGPQIRLPESQRPNVWYHSAKFRWIQALLRLQAARRGAIISAGHRYARRCQYRAAFEA